MSHKRSTADLGAKQTRKRIRTGSSKSRFYREMQDELGRCDAQLHVTEVGPTMDHDATNSEVSDTNEVIGACDDNESDVEIDSAEKIVNNDASYNVLEDDDDDLEGDQVIHRTRDYIIDDTLSLKDQLSRWAVFFSVPAVGVSVILKILVVYKVAINLPVDSRTILKTARTVTTKEMAGGEYFHFGISECIIQFLSNLSGAAFDKLGQTLDLVVGMDGLPGFKSVNSHIWPILGGLRENGVLSKPFTIGIFYGVESKMDVHEYLHDFVRDLNACRTEGFFCRNRNFRVRLWSVVCDAPARAFVKNTLGHAGKNACERCKIRGEKLKGMCFNGEEAPIRTDAGVRNMTDMEHHHGPSPLTNAGVRLVSDVVLDYMHLILLGVIRKILVMWLLPERGQERRICRLKPAVIEQLNSRVFSCSETCPKEFARKPRSFAHIRMFKATELRTFLLYTAIVVAKGFVSPKVYLNLKHLICSMRIYLNDSYSSDIEYRRFAKRSCVAFVKQYRQIYGAREVTYNVHNVIHLHKDNKRYGNLDNVSAFPFENHLQSFKRMLRTGANTLQQIIRRIDEEQRFGVASKDPFSREPDSKFFQRHEMPLPEALHRYRNALDFQCKAIQYGKTRFSVFTADSCIRLRDESVGKINNILRLKDNTTVLVYREYKSRQAEFDKPTNSEDVGISRVSNLSNYLLVVEIEKCRKAWLLPVSGENYFVATDLL